MTPKKVFVAEAPMGGHSEILGAWDSWKGMVADLEDAVRTGQLSKDKRSINAYVMPVGSLLVGVDGFVAILRFKKSNAVVSFINGHTEREVGP